MMPIARSATLAALLGAALSTSCGGGGGSGGPSRLYLALLDSELTVQLVEEEPEPF